jgi:hypothetical protein
VDVTGAATPEAASCPELKSLIEMFELGPKSEIPRVLEDARVVFEGWERERLGGDEQ